MKRKIFYILLGVILCCFASNLSVAQVDHKEYSTYNNETEISAFKSVTLKPGFFIPSGKKVRVFIASSFRIPSNFFGVASSTQNYVLTTVVKRDSIKNLSQLAGASSYDLNQTIQYIDGLGRLLQRVTVQGSPTFKDLVQPVAYDGFGREALKYLPYADQSNTGAYRDDALTKQAGYYSPGSWDADVVKTPKPFSQTIFEPSPLNRVLEQGAPGLVWQPAASRSTDQGRTAVSEYSVNVAADGVKLWVINASGNGATSLGLYADGTLYKTTVKDENWTSGKVGTVDEYKDLEGQVVLKRVWETDTKSLSTYYIYDVLGNLSYVLPPAVNENNSAAAITGFTEQDDHFKKFIYGYHYDGRRRQVEKKIPGKDLWDYIVYNSLDQVVLTQDGKQRQTGRWLFTKYDGLGRVIITGLYASTADRLTVQGLIDTPAEQDHVWETWNSATKSWSNTAFPRNIDSYYGINYYDNYEFNHPGIYNMGSASARTKGLLTGTETAVLGTSNRLLSVNYYDEEGRITRTYKQHYLKGSIDSLCYDKIDNVYSFTDELTASTREHHAGSITTTITTRHEYDHMGRKLASWESINGAPEIVLNKLDYNETGQLKRKWLHSNDGSTFLQNSTYAYNERGWLKSNISDQFKMKLNYNDGDIPQYNGNISGQQWGDGFANKFSYTYDGLNRLLKGISTGVNLNEEMTYDNMGNILTLNRNGGTAGTYSYDGNRLIKITGGANPTTDYAYDINGNSTKDGRNGFTLTYNVLNLPETAINGETNLAYLYSSAGEKMRKTINGTTSRNYINGIEYNGTTIDLIQTEEGIARNNGTNGYSYEYNLTDHLGNVRYVFHKDPNTGELVVRQKTDYYPFGKPSALIVGENKYLYNSKELQDALEQFDYGARFYDPVIGRWNVVDAKAELGRRWSPYVYAFNSPIYFVDPDGMWPSPSYPINLFKYAFKAFNFTSYKIVRMFRAESEAKFVQNYSPIVAGFVSFEAKKAQDLAKSINLGDNNPGGNQNAFRHVLGQSLVASKYGDQVAKSAGDAHEGKYNHENILQNNSDLVDKLKKEGSVTMGINIADSFVDQLNNQVGRDIAKDNPDASSKDLSIKSLEAVRDGKSYVFEINNKTGKATVHPSSMTEEQFKKALKLIQ